MALEVKKKLGALLCKKAYLDETQLERALSEQKHRPVATVTADGGRAEWRQARPRGIKLAARWGHVGRCRCCGAASKMGRQVLQR